MPINELALRPNCLLTRRPILFITGLRSIFFYKKTWGELPELLYQHGYQVKTIQLPFNDLLKRQAAFLYHLPQMNTSHLFLDRFTYYEFEHHFSKLNNSTLTVFSDQRLNLDEQFSFQIQTSNSPSPILFKLHHLFLNHLIRKSLHSLATPGERLLKKSDVINSTVIDHCIRLAEIDFCHLDL